jgi:hypothetical protein
MPSQSGGTFLARVILLGRELHDPRRPEPLGGKTPSELYKASPRRPTRTMFLYPPDWITRTVYDDGTASMYGEKIQIGLALVRQRIAIQPLGGPSHRIWFRWVDLGTVTLAPSNAVIDAVAIDHLRRPLKRGARKERDEKNVAA